MKNTSGGFGALIETRVKVADLAVAPAGRVLTTIGLGSCVAIALYDARARVGGLAHILLPDPTMSRDQSNPAKFPSTAVPILLEEMKKLGANGPILAKIAGGASMFGTLLPMSGNNMGERNASAVQRVLHEHDIPIIGYDTGGDFGRTVYLFTDTGRVTVRSLKRGDIEL